MKQFVWIFVLAVLIPSAIFVASVAKSGERRLGVLETIQGIPFPNTNGTYIVLEEMAHADLFLQEPVLAKQATLTVAFDPEGTDSIDIGVRENEFWLSYVKYPLYQKGIDVPGFQTKEIHIPLSVALQDTDRSVDLMFFTEGPVSWRLDAFRARIDFNMPRPSEIKAYVKSIVTRERPL